MAELSMTTYLPMFLDGVRETEEPYRFIAIQGTNELLGRLIEQQSGHEVIECLDQLVHFLRLALKTHVHGVVMNALNILQKLVRSSPAMGPALTAHYRKLLPTLNLYYTKRSNLGDSHDYKQQEDLGDKIQETLQLMERCGGPEAFMWIKYFIPCWETCTLS
jgi:hypothetical protein